MVEDTAALRVQVARQVAHWRAAAISLQDPESFASAAAWRTLEGYLGVALRGHLDEAAGRLAREADVLVAELRAASGADELERLRRRLIAFRRRYLRVETALDFYGDAINSRTGPRLAGLLRACDTLAAQSMEPVLRACGRPAPPVLVYVDKGLGASVLRAGLRLHDAGPLSPAAAVKITRQGLGRPGGALVHETGHQVAHILGWNDELAALFRSALADTPDVAEAWSSWASEVAADSFSFAHLGYGSVAALHDVVAGGRTVLHLAPGDPHPVPYARVLLGVAMCVRFLGAAGPWNDLASAWVRAHPLTDASPRTRALMERSLPLLPRVVELCLLAPMRAFGGRPLAAIVDPRRVRPHALERLEQEAGGALTTSPYWLRREGLRVLARSAYRAATAPERAPETAREYEDWMLHLGRPPALAAA